MDHPCPARGKEETVRQLLGIAASFAIIVVARDIMPKDWGGYGEAAMALGFVLLVSYLIGQSLSHWGLPAITGYMFVGMVFGPHLLGSLPGLAVLNQHAVDTLQLLDGVALGLIALSAGGELRLAELRANARAIFTILTGQTLFAFGGVTLGVLALGHQFQALDGLTGPLLLVAALLFGVTALANSPATALAIIQESRSQGPVTDLVLAVTVAKDVVVISLFTITLTLVLPMTTDSVQSGGEMWLGLVWEVGGSIVAGILLGMLVAGYMRLVQRELPLMVVGVAFAAVTVLPAFHLSGLLACMVAGFVIENYSPHGETMIRAIERYSLPVYVIFFTIAGANLNLEALAQTWPLALFLAGVRLLMVWLGTTVGAWAGRAPGKVIQFGWSGYMAQAGVTLGFAILIGQNLPGIGQVVQTILLAVIAINQVVGPLAFRLGLTLAGETANARQEEPTPQSKTPAQPPPSP